MHARLYIDVRATIYIYIYIYIDARRYDYIGAHVNILTGAPIILTGRANKYRRARQSNYIGARVNILARASIIIHARVNI